MTCQCGLKLDKCFWPGQCEMDIVRHKTNQQATANHTAKMFNQSRTQRLFNQSRTQWLFNQSRTQWLASDDNSANEPKETKMTRKETHKLIFDKCKLMEGKQVDDFLIALEALGLIKFDEEKSVVDEAKEYIRNYTLYNRQELAGVIDMLIRHFEK